MGITICSLEPSGVERIVSPPPRYRARSLIPVMPTPASISLPDASNASGGKPPDAQAPEDAALEGPNALAAAKEEAENNLRNWQRAAADFANNLDIGILGQDRANAAPGDLMIIDDNQSNRIHFSI